LFKESCLEYIEVIYSAVCSGEQVWDPLHNTLREIALNFTYEMPSKIQAQPEIVKKFILVIVSSLYSQFVTRIPDDTVLTEEWMNPKVEEVQVSQVVVDALALVETMIENLQSSDFLKTLSIKIMELLESDNWRLRVSGLMTLSQVRLKLHIQIGEHIENFEEMEPVVRTILLLIKQDNPHIRSACFHCLGQFAIDNKPDFQNMFATQVVEAVFIGLNDKVVES
jgi:hypothetical protein